MLFNLNPYGIVLRTSTAEPDSLINYGKRQGKKWIGGCSALGLREPSHAPDAYSYWTDILNKNPYLDGLISDEFGHDVEEKPDYQDQYKYWSEAAKKISYDEG